MNGLFPLNQPGPTAFYLCLFVATLAIHFVFMSYVLAGTLWILAGTLSSPRTGTSPITAMLKDWMPLMLSGAITAGVAPLLFIQILYREQFYTANLLQFHRWMAVLPVLIALFYLLYVLKALDGRRRLLQVIASLLCAGCVLFVAWSWVGNHALSLQSQEHWTALYAGTATGKTSGILLRLITWILMTFPTLSLLLAWQRYGATARDPLSENNSGDKWLPRVALCALVATAPSVRLYASQQPENIRDAITSSDALPWLISAATGWLCQLLGWMVLSRVGIQSFLTRVIISAGLILQVAGIMMLREVIRVTTLGERIDFARHADASTSGGLWWFLVFGIVNGAVGVWCIRMVRADHTDASGNH